MERVILHSDLNNFYASVECLLNPSLRGKPVVVGGNEEARHGIVLSKSNEAKSCGIKTAETLLDARKKCKDLITVPAHFDLYLKYAKRAREIYSEYTPLTEPYGIDESWLDVTGSRLLFGSGEKIANEIRRRMLEELGLTVSVGVSYNKIFAKLGSDLKKPDATSVINRENYKEVAWRQPTSDLLFVGHSTFAQLTKMGLYTIGDLAQTDVRRLQCKFGKMGVTLHRYANGQDTSPVTPGGDEHVVKSVSNSNTLARDVTTPEDVKSAIYMLTDSVASRLRGHGLKCTTVQVCIRDKDMFSCDRQGTLAYPTNISGEIAAKAFEVFCEKYKFVKPVRTLGVRVTNLINENHDLQYNFFVDQERRNKLEAAEKMMDKLRGRFGRHVISKGVNCTNREITGNIGFDSETNPLVDLFDNK